MSGNKPLELVAEQLKGMEQIKPPEWASFVKTGVHRMRPPQQKDWWWVRSASVLRKISMSQGVGVERLRRVYGGRKNRGHKPERKALASGSVTRKILQQLEAAGLVKAQKGKGRVITARGKMVLNAKQ